MYAQACIIEPIPTQTKRKKMKAKNIPLNVTIIWTDSLGMECEVVAKSVNRGWVEIVMGSGTWVNVRPSTLSRK